MNPTQNADEWNPDRLLAEVKRTGRRMEEMPVELVRECMRRGFPDMRTIELPPPIIGASLEKPLLRDLLVTRIGYASRAAGHFIPRPTGSLDHIFLNCVAGRGWLRLGGRTWKVTANTAQFIPRGVPHAYGADAKSPWSVYWIHFTGRQAHEYFGALGVSTELPQLHLENNDELLSAFRHVEQHMAEVHTPANLIAASGALARFLALLQLRRFDAQLRQRTDEQNIQQTITFMRENLNRPIALRELAQLAHMSVTRYEAVFAKSTGTSPMHYFNQMRVQKACRLLIETDRPGKVIALQVGMEDADYFSRWFKKHSGASPTVFRARGFQITTKRAKPQAGSNGEKR
jgi:AraC-like DNA-binding protein